MECWRWCTKESKTLPRSTSGWCKFYRIAYHSVTFSNNYGVQRCTLGTRRSCCFCFAFVTLKFCPVRTTAYWLNSKDAWDTLKCVTWRYAAASPMLLTWHHFWNSLKKRPWRFYFTLTIKFVWALIHTTWSLVLVMLLRFLLVLLLCCIVLIVSYIKVSYETRAIPPFLSYSVASIKGERNEKPSKINWITWRKSTEARLESYSARNITVQSICILFLVS